ncbi:hypothetical protein SAY86_022695 [Trapa natans]|uniref:Uncharacterized protein n=1 Tax=Trapa natans TaxID=22666 RepID=A0AAN7R8M1_TRANT|nr:hypothetical protein SAY86_022695 [Trapa natans]
MVKKTPAAISHTKESKLPINGASLIPRMFYHFLKRYLMSNENGITERLKRIIQANASLSQELQESKPLIGWENLQAEVGQYINSEVRGVIFKMEMFFSTDSQA